jgi:ribosomal protein S18 acetylase RimI-like enzyme
MVETEIPALDTKDRQRIYEYIRDEGPVPLEEVMGAELIPVTPDRCRMIVAILKRDGYVTEVEGVLRDDYQPGEVEEVAEDVNYRVREARLEDLSGLAGVVRQVIESETYIVGESVMGQLPDADELLRQSPGAPPKYFLALVDGEVIGWVHLEQRDVDKLDHVVYLTMGLLDEYRGLGIGTKLNDRAVTWAGASGYEKVSSNVPATNASAINFLEKHGWVREGVRPDQYHIDGEFVDEVLLSCRP